MIKFLWINAIDSASEVETRYPPLGIGYLVASLKRSFGDDAFLFQVASSDIETALDKFQPDIVGISAVSQNYGRAILYAAEAATKIALDAIQILGGMGYINDSPTGRLLRDAKLYEIGAGTSEIRRMLIGRELFRETA